MKKIAILYWCPFNYGDRAIVIGTLKSLKKLIPEIHLTVLSPCPEIDIEDYAQYGASVRKTPWISKFAFSGLNQKILNFGIPTFITLFSCFLWRIFRPLKTPVIGGLQQYDIFIELGASTHTFNRSRNIIGVSYSFFTLLLGLVMNKPFVMCAESFGPFKGKLYRSLAKFFINRASLITIRDNASLNNLHELDINNDHIYVTSDPAFLFISQCSKERAKEILASEGISKGDQPLIGISVSDQIYLYAFPEVANPQGKYEKYIELMTEIADCIVAKLDANLILIPHSIFAENDDRYICNKICQNVTKKTKIKSLTRDYTVDEVKSVIGLCQLFIGTRLHSLIASSTMHVPSIAMARDSRYTALSCMLDSEIFIMNIMDRSYGQLLTDLCTKFDYVWDHRSEIARHLKEKESEVTEEALLNAVFVKEILHL